MDETTTRKTNYNFQKTKRKRKRRKKMIDISGVHVNGDWYKNYQEREEKLRKEQEENKKACSIFCSAWQ